MQISAEMKHTPSLHSLRDVSPTPLQGASLVAGETPATAIAGLACSAAAWLAGFDTTSAAYP